jgi:hypothetical protein
MGEGELADRFFHATAAVLGREHDERGVREEGTEDCADESGTQIERDADAVARTDAAGA